MPILELKLTRQIKLNSQYVHTNNAFLIKSEKHLTAYVCTSVCMSTWFCTAPLGGIFVKLILGTFEMKVCRETSSRVTTGKHCQSLYTEK